MVGANQKEIRRTLEKENSLQLSRILKTRESEDILPPTNDFDTEATE